MPEKSAPVSRICQLAGVAALLVGGAPASVSADDYCPGPIAIVEDLDLNARVLTLVKGIYRELGCELTTAAFPGRRGVVAFNAGDVSGELFRLPLIEGSYETGFVRSQQPVLEPRQAIWIEPSGSLDADSRIGYVIGRWWQEEFAQANAGRHQFVEYTSAADLWSDYERHALDGFLATPALVTTLVEAGKLTEPPAMAQLITSAPMYHYLDAAHAPFMTDFSRVLKEQVPTQ